MAMKGRTGQLEIQKNWIDRENDGHITLEGEWRLQYFNIRDEGDKVVTDLVLHFVPTE